MFRRVPFVVLWCLVACQRTSPRSAEAPQLVEVRVRDRSVGAVTLDVEALQKRALADVEQAKVLRVAPPGTVGRDGIDYRLSLDVAASDPAQVSQLRAAVSARLTRLRSSTAPIVAEAVAERALRPEEAGDRAAAGRAHVERAVDDLLRELSALVKVHLGDQAQLLEALHSPDADLRAEAARVAGERKERAAVDALLELVRQSDARCRDVALGALVEIGDRRAVPALTRAVPFRAVEELPKIIDAAAALGGDEARAYLEFVAGTHEDREIRALAKEALTRLDRRAAAADAAR